MNINLTIPEKVEHQSIMEFRVRPGSKMITVLVQTEDGPKRHDTDISEIWDAATATQKNVIKQFFKRTANLAIDAINNVDIEDEDIDGDLFDE